MKKKIKKFVGGIVLTGFIAVSMQSAVFAAQEESGASAALKDSKYSLEEMLTYSMEDEYLALTEYQVIEKQYGEQKPFSNLIKAEEKHIQMLEPLFDTYKLKIPSNDWSKSVQVPKTIEDSYVAGKTAEEKNIEMYTAFLKEDLPDDVRDTFEKLLNASKRHEAAFQRRIETGDCDNLSNETRGNRNRNGNGSKCGNQNQNMLNCNL